MPSGMRREPQRAETVLWEMFRRLGIEGRVRESGAVVAWDGVVGPAAAGRSRAVACQAGTLVVEVSSSSWMQELSCLSGDIRAKLNQELGGEWVKQIVFRTPRDGYPASS